MSEKDPYDLNYFHNKGEQDQAEGNGYNPPNDFMGGLFNRAYEDDQRIAYGAGWDNAKKQSHDE